jgi:cellulose synthase/poly-beta-1,6-N-acetylglucosamine synthase-like glycosyltransferase
MSGARFYRMTPSVGATPHAGVSDPPSTDLREEHAMHISQWIRQLHRWLSILFTATVIANFAAMTQGTPPAWITYSPLVPLFLLLFSGLYMFFLPYARKWRGAANAVPAAAE